MKALNGLPRSADDDATETGAISSSGKLGDSGPVKAGADQHGNPATSGGGGDGATMANGLLVEGTDVESNPGLQKKGLRVSFPEFEVVSGYMDPPRPWNDVSQCSTSELVASYLSACEKVGVKPNSRLLSQLQVITNFDNRNETLTLKNENLDARHCETLEEVFRRVQFRTIDLEATKLEEEGAVTIFDMIEYYESCLKLNISYSKNLGQRGWQACSRMIRKTPCLENLEVRGAVLSDFVMPILGRSLRVSSSLTSLHLEFAITSGKPLQVLVAALKVNETLKELYLADNKLMPSDGIQLGSLLRYNRTMHLLDLRNNHLQDTGFLHICEGIWEQGKGNGLNTLVVWNNQLSYQAMNHLSKALLNSTSLETINLGHNNLTNEGMHRLKESLLKNKSLLRMGLQAAKITCEGAVALAEFIAESIKLVRLDLRENEIKTGGLMALSLALKVSESVTRVDLDKDPKKESGVKDYAEQQKRLLNDITMYMQRNRALARRREEEEIAQETERLSAAEPDTQTEPSQEEEKMAEETVKDASDRAELVDPEDVIVAVDDRKEIGFTGGESSPRHRMNLTLELKTRCEMLESPDFVPESEMPPPEMPSEDSAKASTLPDARVAKRKVIIDIPPSPMVSSQGKTVLVPVLAGPMSPNFDDQLSPNEDEKLNESVGSDDRSTVNDQSFSSASEADDSDKSPGFWDHPGSPLSSLGLSSSGSGAEDNGSHISLTADSYHSHHDHSLGRAQTKKTSLKMTRPRHRFQVSKTNLPHKPANRRGSGGGGGSHKTAHAATEHSRNEAPAMVPSLMTSLAAFQSLSAITLDNGRMNSDNSAVSLFDGVARSEITFDSVSGIESAIRLNSSASVGNQNMFDLQKSSVSSSNVDSSVENSAESAPSVVNSASDVAEIQNPLPINDQRAVVVASENIIPGTEDISVVNPSDEIKSFSLEDQMNQAPEQVPIAAPDGKFSTLQDDKASVDEKTKATNHPEGFVSKDLIEKSSLHLSNGLTLDLAENLADFENLGDEVQKLSLEKVQNNSSDDFPNVEKLIV